MRKDMSTNDVEKHWHDPAAFRAATAYVVSVIALASLSFALFRILGPSTPMWALGTPLVLFAGCAGAFIKTYRVWRAGRTWPIWQGAGWVLLTLSLFSLSILGIAT
ncbi:hypothetical protein NGTWS0302_18290 [Mycolicibacterium cyprinidarum]|uniref:Transmembrane protein n=1 Tax=Mycolicibacterium cyprinidarum TaxID=2860311 RepID=A0ABQ4VAK4_9MYCO|nr:hypothetical protein NGTWS1702_15780 [Mycolicibacterium sp. NGTWSNA01]GJF15659.1 hypothetical protein NGTWS1803_00810 [Mycolicibacterium sp. NGTWS1803]GJF19448.1 hypothetical protein NGTWS0302_18290 [Mycolicibacterium sp. NGTWS0302]